MDPVYIKRVFKEPEQSYFLFGPRGTGKSTMVKNRHPDALTIDLLNPETRFDLAGNPNKFLDMMKNQPNGKTVIIDEIQKVPELLSIVHILIEQKRNFKFILTGSSARKLRREGINLLGGRAHKKLLHPFMACELGEQFNLVDALTTGLLPLRFGSKDSKTTLLGYLSLYLEEEVLAEGLVRQYENFTRFLSVMSFSHGSTLNLTNIARECYVKRTTVNDWLGILKDLLIGHQIEQFTQRAKRELSAHPKFYLFDTGVYRALRPQSIGDAETEIDGPGLEGLVAQHLVAWKDYTNGKHTINFWRTRSGSEVDFIIFGELGFWAIEVKNSKHIHPDDLRGLTAFLEDYPEAKGILLYRGKFSMLMKNILCIPCDEFLKEVVPNKALVQTLP